jgi:predicted DNA-binding transcriptional regulator YafY
MNHIIDTIKQAAGERKVLKIVYLEKDGTSEGWRYVEPYSFSRDDGEDGLFAWDINKAGIRRFSINRINDAQVTDEAFNPRYGVEI